MATPCFPPPVGARLGPNTAAPSEADMDLGARFFSHYLDDTCPIVALARLQLTSFPRNRLFT